MTRPGDVIGRRFRILAPLGAGATGEVLRARDAKTGRDVALKLLGDVRDAEARERFAREGRAAATVASPYVCALVASGEDGGRPWLAFELASGGTLGNRVAAGPVPWPEALRLGAGVARGLAAIHAAGLLHRDVKPANVLLDEKGEPRLADLGLSRSSSDDRLTRTGELLGTIEYAAPEQANGTAVGPAADLYGLGATLYALLAGRPPFEGTGYDLVRRVIGERPPPLPGVPAPVAALVERLLAKDPRARGASADAVAAELEALVTGGPMRAPRRRLGFVLGVASGVASGLALLGALAAAAWTRGAAPAPSPTAAPTPSRTPTVPSPAATRALDPEVAWTTSAFATHGLERVIGSYTWKAPSVVADLAVSPDGAWAVTGSRDGHVALWDLAIGRAYALACRPMWIRGVGFGPEGDRVFAVGSVGELFVWDVASRARVFWADVNAPLAGNAVAAALPGHRILSGGAKGALRIWNADRGELERELPAATPERGVIGIACDPLGRRALENDEDGVAYVRDLATGEVRRVGTCTRRLATMAFDGSGGRVAWRSEEQSATVLDLATGSSFTLELGLSPLSFVFEPGDRLRVAGDTGEVETWDLRTRLEAGPRGRVAPFGYTKLAADPEACRYVAGTEDGRVVSLDASLAVAATSAEDLGSVGGLEVFGSPERLATVDLRGNVRVWDPARGAEVATVVSHQPALHALGVSADGKRVAFGGEERAVLVAALEGEPRVTKLETWGEALWWTGWDPRGRWLLSASRDGVIARWPLDGTPAKERKLDGETRIAAVSPGGSELAVGINYQNAGAVVLLSAASLEEHARFELPTFVSAVTFGASSLLVGDVDGTLRFVDPLKLQETGKLEGAASNAVTAIASSRKRLAAVARVSGEIDLVDEGARALLERVELGASVDHAMGLAFSSDGRTLYAGTARGVILAFDVRR